MKTLIATLAIGMMMMGCAHAPEKPKEINKPVPPKYPRWVHHLTEYDNQWFYVPKSDGVICGKIDMGGTIPFAQTIPIREADFFESETQAMKAVEKWCDLKKMPEEQP